MIKKVYGSKVLLEVLLKEEDRDYIVPESSKETSHIAKVAYVGEKVIDTKPEDLVVFPKYEYTEMEILGTTYIIIEEEDLICKIEENE